MLETTMSNNQPEKKITILGVGNTLFQDEGVGVHILPLLEEAIGEDPLVEIIEGSTDGMRLLGPIEETNHLIIIDAINAGKPGGTLITLVGDEIPAYFGVKMSIHQLGFQEVLGAAMLRDRYPKNIIMFGMQPTALELGVGLTEANERMLPELVDLVIQQVNNWRELA